MSSKIRPIQLPSDLECLFYYKGLPSGPRLVGRSGTTLWQEPRGPEAYSRPKTLKPVGRHPLEAVWEKGLCESLVSLLQDNNILWTSVDVVRIGYRDSSFFPVVIWIGVEPNTVSLVDGTLVALRCYGILCRSGIIDVEVEMRESCTTSLAGPKLLGLVSDRPTAKLREPINHALGLPISCSATPHVEGTGSLFIAEGGASKSIFLLTARHVVLPVDLESNRSYVLRTTSEPRRKVTLMGSGRFEKFTKDISDAIVDANVHLTTARRQVVHAEDPILRTTNESIDKTRKKLAKAGSQLQAVEAFGREITAHWTGASNRELGHVIYAPPVLTNIGQYGHTLDIALVDLDLQKLDVTSFRGNLINIGNQIDDVEFHHIMRPNHRAALTVEYPIDGVLVLRGTIPEDEIRCPSSLDENDDPCLVVMKNGSTTGLTFGRANNVRSVVRNYFSGEEDAMSMEWCIAAHYKPQKNHFSEPGDSGAIVVDGRGRIGGMITGGTGHGSWIDLTYATGIHRIMDSIKQQYPGAHLYPTLGP
ncbi:MAG: hypothetical protein M1815_001771 [Lichina confinis]|nr:MAG: hypothetical protein M1815_001771 [Lichina confinis]